jgi:hypothetical protein
MGRRRRGVRPRGKEGRRVEGMHVSGVSRRVRRYLDLGLYESESGHGNREIGGLGMSRGRGMLEIEGEGGESEEPMLVLV